MKPDIRAMLERQASWQRSRSHRSWADKLRASLVMRRNLEGWRKQSPQRQEEAETASD